MPEPAAPARVRTGTISAYIGSGDAALVRHVRDVVGRVTLSGRSGLKILKELAAAGDLDHVDFDPAGYLPQQDDGGSLLEPPLVSRQRDLRLSVIRSTGYFVPKGDLSALRTAMTCAVEDSWGMDDRPERGAAELHGAHDVAFPTQ